MKTPCQVRAEQVLSQLRRSPVPVVTRGEINRVASAVSRLRELGYTIEIKLNLKGYREFHLIGES